MDHNSVQISSINLVVGGDSSMLRPPYTIHSPMAKQKMLDCKEAFFKVCKVRAIGVQSPVGLAQHAYRRHEFQPSSTISGSSVQDTLSYCFITTQA